MSRILEKIKSDRRILFLLLGFIVLIIAAIIITFVVCVGSFRNNSQSENVKNNMIESTAENVMEHENVTENTTENITENTTEALKEEATTEIEKKDEDIAWDSSWKYADFSEIHDDDVHLYRTHADDRRNIIVAVNAGHGTEGGEDVKTYCHPDKSEKVTGGTNGEGSIKALAVSGGMEFIGGYPEAKATLSLAILVKDELLESGFDVLMIRENDDTQLDNVARTVFANNNADYHISLHYDSTESDKGAFYVSVPDEGNYKEMEPVASIWEKDDTLGEALIQGLEDEGVKIWSDGEMAIDLTQTSFSTIPTVDLEVGDAASDYSEEAQTTIAKGIVRGMISLTE